MFQRPAVAFVLAFLLLALSSCLPSGSREPAGKAASSPTETWFVLENGRLVEVAGSALPGAAAEAFVAWTNAERIGGFARLGGALYASVNGYGVTRIASDGSAFAYFYDRSLFGGRTLQAMLSEADALLCHVYRNTLLGDRLHGQGLEPPNLVRMRPGRDGYAADFLLPPFQAAGPEWQAVSLARASDGLAWLEWKKVSGDRVDFAYTTFDLATLKETPVTREAFRAANAGVPLQGFAPRPGRALDLLVEHVASSARPGDYLCISVGGDASAGPYVRVPEGGAGTTRRVAAFAQGGRALALEPDGTLLSATDGSSQVSRLRLPLLPPGYVYCDLVAAGATLVASWEQVDFFRVGRAGLLVRTGGF